MDIEHAPPPSPKTTPRETIPRKTSPRLGRDAVVAGICGLVVVLMVGAAYAAVPFYNWFCRATGFNGTTQVATSAPSGAPLARKVTVRFDAIYGVTSLVLGAGMLACAVHVYRRRERAESLRATRKMFAFSILYLFALFATLLLEVTVRGIAASIG